MMGIIIATQNSIDLIVEQYELKVVAGRWINDGEEGKKREKKKYNGKERKGQRKERKGYKLLLQKTLLKPRVINRKFD